MIDGFEFDSPANKLVAFTNQNRLSNPNSNLSTIISTKPQATFNPNPNILSSEADIKSENDAGCGFNFESAVCPGGSEMREAP